jgi:type IV secretory pathway TrbD component
MVATIFLLVLVAAFIGIVIWVFGRSAKRALRLAPEFLSTITRVISHDDGRLIGPRTVPISDAEVA